MTSETNNSASAAPLHYRGPQGLGEEVARALEQNSRANKGSAGVAEQTFLKAFFEEKGSLIPQDVWEALRLVTNHTSEHEVRFREDDRRAVKKTIPGTFGFVPGWSGTKWEVCPANASEYLHRLHLQNTLFQDEIRLEGAAISSGPSMLIGEPTQAFSFVISQPWLEAADIKAQYPTVGEIHELLSGIGFHPVSDAFYGWLKNDRSIMVLDAKPDNFIMTEAGPLPIDLLLAECLPN